MKRKSLQGNLSNWIIKRSNSAVNCNAECQGSFQKSAEVQIDFSSTDSNAEEVDRSESSQPDLQPHLTMNSNFPPLDIALDTSITPYQPNNHVPKAMELEDGKAFNFQLKWYSKYTWLHLIPGEDAVVCFLCREASKKEYFSTNMKIERAFLDVGFRNWRKGTSKFNDHQSSKQHQTAMAKIAESKSNNIAKSLGSAVSLQMEQNRRALKAICTSLKFLARQGLAVQGHTEEEGHLIQLLRLRSKEITPLRTWFSRSKHFTSHDIQNELFEIMSRTVLQNILEEIRSAEFFSLMLDETTDVSTKEQLSICIRYVDKSLEPHEKFLGLYELDSTTGESIANAVKDVLIRFDLPLNKIRGQCYDGASNMKGKLRGVQARLHELEDRMVFVHCFNHSLELALQDAVKQIQIMRDVLHYVHDASVLISRSAKRLKLFEDAARDLEVEDSIKLKTLCPTRWCVRVKSLRALLDNYSVVLLALEKIMTTSDKCGPTASGLLKQFETYESLFAVMALYHFFIPCENLATLLQSEKLTLTGSISAAKILINHLTDMRSDLSYETFKAKVDRKSRELDIDPPVNPRKRKVPDRYKEFFTAKQQPASTADRLRNTYDETLCILIDELNVRFNQPGLHEYSLFEELLVNKDCVENPDAISLLKKHKINIEMLKPQLQMFWRETGTCPSTAISDSITSFKSLNLNVQRMLNEVNHLVQLLLVIPSSTAIAERSFSMLRRVKTYL